jgi:lipopolysaccharide transport system ATP-binding protein
MCGTRPSSEGGFSVMAPAIRVENLGKLYHVAQGGPRASYRTFRELITNAASAPFRKLRGQTQAQREAAEFWALKDVSFEVQPGEVVGIIGRNGAGKSTLLKILSRITKPTKGRVELNGRIGSLLEVGTGFHPELTGRENVYLNGSILGMSRREIDRKFDEIVAFAEVERFLDTPVKRYSSGMYVRLAFAVAAHLEPEILIVDEVLAVGDAGFQKKCLGKMEEVGQTGRTVLFVSHNMPAITRLCKRCILLSEGLVIKDSTSADVAAYYVNQGDGSGAERVWGKESMQPGSDVVKFLRFAVVGVDGKPSTTHDIRESIWLELDYQVHIENHVLVPNFHFYTDEGTCAFVLHDTEPIWRRKGKSNGVYRARVEIPGNLLNEGTLFVGAAISTYDPFYVHVYERDAIAFRVLDTLSGETSRGDYAGHVPGIVRPLLNWSTKVVAVGPTP